LISHGVAAYHLTSRYISPSLTFSSGKSGGSIVELRDSARNEVEALAKRAIAALPNIWSGAVHLDIYRRSSGDLVVGEVACRPAGNRIRGMLFLAYGVDPVRSSVRAQCGVGFRLPREVPRPTAWGAVRSRPGKLVREIRRASAPPGVVSIKLHKPLGSEMAAPKNAEDNFASFLVSGRNEEEVLARRLDALAWLESSLQDS
jgi:biotin carboxylase